MFVSILLLLFCVSTLPPLFLIFFFLLQQIKSICYLSLFLNLFSLKNSVIPSDNFTGEKTSQGYALGNKARAPRGHFSPEVLTVSPRHPWDRGQLKAQPAETPRAP